MSVLYIRKQDSANVFVKIAKDVMSCRAVYSCFIYGVAKVKKDWKPTLEFTCSKPECEKLTTSANPCSYKQLVDRATA